MFDSLYVLAKGGVCVYSGTPQRLPNRLRECNIICTENQVPINTLITIGSKGLEDNRIIELRDKTYSETNQSINRRINETKEKHIKHRNKSFRMKDIYLLLERRFVELIAYKYFRFAIDLSVCVLTVLSLSFIFGTDVGDYKDCIPLNPTKSNATCFDQLIVQKNSFLEMFYLVVVNWTLEVIVCILSVLLKMIKLKALANEHQKS